MGGELFYTHKGQRWIFYFVKWNNRLFVMLISRDLYES